jgi:hypothetical protein
MKTPNPKASHFMNTYDASTHKIKLNDLEKINQKFLNLHKYTTKWPNSSKNNNVDVPKLKSLTMKVLEIATFLPLDFMLGGNKIKYQLGYFKVDTDAK